MFQFEELSAPLCKGVTVTTFIVCRIFGGELFIYGVLDKFGATVVGGMYLYKVFKPVAEVFIYGFSETAL